MINRKLQLVSPEVGRLLENQLVHELKNANLYRSFANACGIWGIVDLEEYFNKRAIEEQHHHDWIFKYLSAADFRITYPAIPANTEIPTSPISAFKFTVDREIQTTQLIYAIYEKCLAEKDYMTASWLLETLIKEQIEEENTSRMALVIIEETSDIFIRANKILKLLK